MHSRWMFFIVLSAGCGDQAEPIRYVVLDSSSGAEELSETAATTDSEAVEVEVQIELHEVWPADAEEDEVEPPGETIDQDEVEPDGDVATPAELDAASVCTPVCQNGSRVCTDEGVAICVEQDGCLAWSEPVACDPGQACADGFCVVQCTDACPAHGLRRCSGDMVETCKDHDGDGCLGWGGLDACAPGTACQDGFCTVVCPTNGSACSVQGATACDGDGVRTCAVSGGGCLTWGETIPCASGQTCSNGVCSVMCADECATAGSQRCLGNAVQVCGLADTDICLDWGPAAPCAAGQLCADGKCAATCVDQCQAVGALTCIGDAVATCADEDSDGCLEWGSPVSCGVGEECIEGLCAALCSPECDEGATRCDESSAGVETCIAPTDDGCTEWGASVPCAPGYACLGGTCSLGCTSSCAIAGETSCNAENTGVQTCGDPSGTGCLSWGAATGCGPAGVCHDGECEEAPVPGPVVINELHYAGGASDPSAFVELYGPPGLDVTGFELVGVDGANGASYGAVMLVGALGPDGLFVLAAPGSSAAVLEAADQLSPLADYQDGPDSVQLRWGQTVVDAVGYGSFGGELFAGEGFAAVAVPLNQSLGRDAASSDSGDNAADFQALASPSPGAINGLPNKPPSAKLSCPSSVATGDSVSANGSTSTDNDGTIAIYAFDWGDGSSISGSTSTRVHTFATAASYTISLTVTDDRGATGSATCTIAVGDAKAPKVVVLSPSGDIQVARGKVVPVTVDVTAAAGRSVAAAQLVIDGTEVGLPDLTLPYSFTYSVPGDAIIDAALRLQVKATDNAGSIGYSGVRNLNVRDDKPVAALSVNPTGNLIVTADASGCADTETLAASLEVRFDWESDGIWDTDFSTTKVVSHTYAIDGEHTVRVEVRDASGQVASTARTINFVSTRDVSGTIATTLWYGTINVLADVTVPEGQTLSVAPGTQIRMHVADDDLDGTGDVDLIVKGKLILQGSVDEPVLIVPLEASGEDGVTAWGTIRLEGTGGHIVSHAVIARADTALDVRSAATLSDLEVRNGRVGLALAAAGITGEDVRVHDCAEDGVTASSAATFTITGLSSTANGGRGLYVTGGGASQLTGCSLSQNGSHGAELDSTKVSFERCSFEQNGGTGLYYHGNAGGQCLRATIRANDNEGVRAHWGVTGNPTAAVTDSNIFDNGASGSMAAATTTWAIDSAGAGTLTTPPLAPPGGGQILLAEVDFYANAGNASILEGESGTTVLASYVAGAADGFRDFSATSPSVIRLKTVATSALTNRISIPNIVYTSGPPLQVATYLLPGVTGKFDLRRNYLGTWPNVLDAVGRSAGGTVLLGGFVSVPYDDTFTSPSNEWGEISITGNTTWSDDVYVTGIVTVQNGATLTLSPGANVIFVPMDEDGDGAGDGRIVRSNGNISAAGTAEAPIVFSAMHSFGAGIPPGGGYVGVAGKTSGKTNLKFVTFLDSTTAVSSGVAGTTALTDVTVESPMDDGVHLAEPSVVTRLTVRGAGASGVTVYATPAATLDRLVVEDSAVHGVRFESITSHGTKLTNATLTGNGDAGVRVASAYVSVTQSNIKFNAWGVFVTGASAGSVSSSNIQSNNREGIFVGYLGTEPTMTFTGNNIVGNTQTEASSRASLNYSLQDSGFSGGTSLSTVYAPPTGGEIIFYSVSATKTNWGWGFLGTVLGATGAIRTFAYGTNGTVWHDVPYPYSETIQAMLVGSPDTDAYGTFKLLDVIQVSPATPMAEMAVMRVAATEVNATGNYWGVASPTSAQIVQLVTGTANYSASKPAAIPGTGPL